MEWTKTSDALPEKYIRVLVYDNKNDVIKIDMCVNEIIATPIGYSWQTSYRGHITHWMPLPLPPSIK